ncbi:MAG: hypothetical protein OEZ09_02545, partial [Betaproteobacteria bacterium]|nr:hypothetical protein [Betaproteobacteria bacterium]
MGSINRALRLFILFYVVAITAPSAGAGLHRPADNAPDCAASHEAAAGTSPHSTLHAGKACKDKKAYALTVTLEGAGSGRVSSAPAGIFCQTDCGETFAKNTQITLSAQPYTGSAFTGWSGDCSGAGPCSIKLKADTAVVANFARVEPPPLTLVTPYVNESDMREINDFFNAQHSDGQWGRIHDGLDIDPNGNLRPFQSACAGRVRKIYVFDNQVTLII